MNLISKILAAAALTGVLTGAASAALSQVEADQLGGPKLTEFGAERAGNAEGTIPAYTGGLPVDTAPPGWKKGSGRYEQNPFEDEKPLFSINAANMDKYADKLSAGTIALMKKYPEYRLDIYPTHRSVGYPEKYLEDCKTNATTTKLTETGNGVIGGHGCVPFPMPKNGLEALWSYQLRNWYGVYTDCKISNWLIDGSGHITDLADFHAKYLRPYADIHTDTMPDIYYNKQLGDWLGPPSQVGTKILTWDSLDYDKSGALAWFYSPGQRRTRLAPEFAYDTPVAAYGGAIDYDEQYGFSGEPDRFDWKLVGKKELYVPYNSYKLVYASLDQAVAGKGFINPDVNRYELHRVWVVESTLKPGKRHIYSRRTFYIDEDSWSIMASDSYDSSGKLYRVGFFPLTPLWDVQGYASVLNFYDLSKSGYLLGVVETQPDGYFKVSTKTPTDTAAFTADSLAARGVR